MLRVCKLEPDRHLRARFNLYSSFLKERNLVEEESLSAIFLTPKVKGETKQKKSQNTLKNSKFQVQLKVCFRLGWPSCNQNTSRTSCLTQVESSGEERKVGL